MWSFMVFWIHSLIKVRNVSKKQISILEWFLNDHVTLRTLLYFTNKCSHGDFFQKHLKILPTPNFWTVVYKLKFQCTSTHTTAALHATELNWQIWPNLPHISLRPSRHPYSWALVVPCSRTHKRKGYFLVLFVSVAEMKAIKQLNSTMWTLGNLENYKLHSSGVNDWTVKYHSPAFGWNLEKASSALRDSHKVNTPGLQNGTWSEKSSKKSITVHP